MIIQPLSAQRVLIEPQGASLVRLEPSPVSETPATRIHRTNGGALRDDGGVLRSISIPDRGEDHPLQVFRGPAGIDAGLIGRGVRGCPGPWTPQ